MTQFNRIKRQQDKYPRLTWSEFYGVKRISIKKYFKKISSERYARETEACLRDRWAQNLDAYNGTIPAPHSISITIQTPRHS